MAVYERQTRLQSSLSDVWAFHSTVDGLRAVTPSWLNLTVHDIKGPDNVESHVLEAGTRLEMSTQPFGVGPKQRWTTVIEDRAEQDGVAYFVDVMKDGPFPEWRHLHIFYDNGDDTLIRDRVEYELPGQWDLFDPAGNLGMAVYFRRRHRRTRNILED